MDKRDTESETGSSSQDFEAGSFDRLSGFFTPVWDSRRRDREPSPSLAKPAKTDLGLAPQADPARKGAMSDASKSRAARAAQAAKEVHQLLSQRAHRRVDAQPGVDEETGPLARRSQGPVASALPQPLASEEEASDDSQAATLRRLRRTIRLYTPLPERVMRRIAKAPR